MRQGQQNRRGRGRNNNNNNNNNRKNQNPLSRSFESNGPDVKIRGTPAHIAEKYMALARDAQSSGDHVLAENYLQHAEHYNRIIMAYREQFAPQGGDGLNGNGRQPQEGSAEEGGEDESDDILDEGFQNSQPHMAAYQPQPQQQHRPQGEGRFEGNRDHNRGDQQHRQDRQDRPFRRDRDHQRFRDRNHDRGGDRQMRDDRPMRDERPMRDDRPMRDERPVRDDRPMRDDRPPRDDRPMRDDRPPREERQPVEQVNGEVHQQEPRRAPRERFPQATHEQPDFLRRPVRRPRAESTEAPAPSKDEPRE